jgi:hypothetical protein
MQIRKKQGDPMLPSLFDHQNTATRAVSRITVYNTSPKKNTLEIGIYIDPEIMTEVGFDVGTVASITKVAEGRLEITRMDDWTAEKSSCVQRLNNRWGYRVNSDKKFTKSYPRDQGIEAIVGNTKRIECDSVVNVDKPGSVFISVPTWIANGFEKKQFLQPRIDLSQPRENMAQPVVVTTVQHESSLSAVREKIRKQIEDQEKAAEAIRNKVSSLKSDLAHIEAAERILSST